MADLDPLARACDRLTRTLRPQRIAVLDDEPTAYTLARSVFNDRDVRGFERPVDIEIAHKYGWTPDLLLLDVYIPGVQHELWLPRLHAIVARIVVYSDIDDVPGVLRDLPRIRKAQLGIVGSCLPRLLDRRVLREKLTHISMKFAT